jgi:hypothetical protein
MITHICLGYYFYSYVKIDIILLELKAVPSNLTPGLLYFAGLCSLSLALSWTEMEHPFPKPPFL